MLKLEQNIFFKSDAISRYYCRNFIILLKKIASSHSNRLIDRMHLVLMDKIFNYFTPSFSANRVKTGFACHRSSFVGGCFDEELF